MHKEIPAPITAAAVPPDLNRAYFEECASFPFSPRATHRDLRNAWWIAEASFAAYDDFDANGRGRVNLDALRNAGFTVRAESRGDTQFLAIENPGVLIIAFRGTRVEGFSVPFLSAHGVAANWADIVTDARFLLSPFEAGVAAHGGFVSAFRAIEQPLDDVIGRAQREGRAVWLGGHSLGGALATLAAYKYRQQVQGLCTFGSPSVGNGRFVERLISDLPNIYRFVHHRDVVTTVPPKGISLDPAELLRRLNPGAERQPLGYSHVGNLQFISGNKTWHIAEGDPATESIRDLARFSFAHAREFAAILTHGFSVRNVGTWPIPFEVLADHAPVYYANKIFNACEDERRRNG